MLFLFYSRKGLYISDVPLHDAARDLVLLSEKFEAEYKLTKNLEMLTDKLQQTFRDLESEKQKTDRWEKWCRESKQKQKQMRKQKEGKKHIKLGRTMNEEQQKSLHAFRREIKITRTFSLHLFVIHSGRAASPSALDTPDRLLYSVLPKSVANELRHQRPVPPKR